MRGGLLSQRGAATQQFKFAMHDNFASLKDDFSCACVSTTDTLAAEATAGNDYIDMTTLAVAQTYSVGNGIAIPAAGTASAELLTSVWYRSGVRLYLNTTIKTTVAAGGIVYHDDAVGVQAGVSDANAFYLYNPGDCMLTSGIDYTKANTQILGSDMFTKRHYPFVEGRSSSFISRFDTDDIFYLGSDRCGLVGNTIHQHSSVVRTGGFCIQDGPKSVGYKQYDVSAADTVYSSTILNVYCNEPWIAYGGGRTFYGHVEGLAGENYRKNVIELDRPLPFGGTVFNGISGSGHGPSSYVLTAGVGSAVLVKRSDLCTWHGLDVWRVLNGFEVANTTTGNVGLQKVNGGFIDNIVGGYAVKLTETTAGTNLANNFVGLGANTTNALGTYYITTNGGYNALTNVCSNNGVGTNVDTDGTSIMTGNR